MKTHFADPADLLNFTLTITPDEGQSKNVTAPGRDLPGRTPGMYKGGAFVFSFAINTNYPHDPPKVKCTQTVRSHLVASSRLQSFIKDMNCADLPPER